MYVCTCVRTYVYACMAAYVCLDTQNASYDEKEKKIATFPFVLKNSGVKIQQEVVVKLK